MQNNSLQIAIEFARKLGYDTVRPAGEKDGYFYFHYFNQANIGHKLGLPHIIKIGETGEIFDISELSEIRWAMRKGNDEEIKLS